VEQKQSTPRRTSVYVDDYNLYYGRLRGTQFKWLDLVAYFDAMLKRRDQNEVLTKVNIYTAWAFARFSTHGEASAQAQSACHRALQHCHGDRLSITYGTHSLDESVSLLLTFVEGQSYNRNVRSSWYQLGRDLR